MTNLPTAGSPPTSGTKLRPSQIVLRRLRKGCYKLSAVSFAGMLGGSFLLELTPLAIVAGFTSALFVGTVGVLLEVVENDLTPGGARD